MSDFSLHFPLDDFAYVKYERPLENGEVEELMTILQVEAKNPQCPRPVVDLAIAKSILKELPTCPTCEGKLSGLSEDGECIDCPTCPLVICAFCSVKSSALVEPGKSILYNGGICADCKAQLEALSKEERDATAVVICADCDKPFLSSTIDGRSIAVKGLCLKCNATPAVPAQQPRGMICLTD